MKPSIAAGRPGNLLPWPVVRTPEGSVRIMGPSIPEHPQGSRRDARFHRIVQETLDQDFRHFNLALQDREGRKRATQPFFVCPLDLLQGTPERVRRVFAPLRPFLNGYLTPKTLMVGSPVGHGELTVASEDQAWSVRTLGNSLPSVAQRLGASLILLKEFPSTLRPVLSPLHGLGYVRVPSMPYVTLDIDFRNFDEHMKRSLSKVYRKNLRKKFRDAEAAPPITMEVRHDISEMVDELFPLYLQVYQRSLFRFERLTPEYLCRIGRELPDRTRFFVWRQEGRPVAFSVCTLREGELWGEYLGMDYRVALDLHLYFVTMRDRLNWCCRNGIRRYVSGPLNYDPKLHLKFRLAPMDLYVRHTNPILHAMLSRAAAALSPATYDPLLRQFPNADEL